MVTRTTRADIGETIRKTWTEDETAAALREYHGRPDLDRVRAFFTGAAWMFAIMFTTSAVVWLLVWFLWV